MRLTPTERDRLLLFGAAELARARRARGLRLNVPEATALVADTVCEAARDGARLAEAVAAARKALGPDDVLPGVPDVVTEIHVEAVFDDGTRLAVVSDPFGGGSLGAQAPGAVLPAAKAPAGQPAAVRTVSVRNTASVPISVTSHFHFFEANPRLDFDRSTAFGMRLAMLGRSVHPVRAGLSERGRAHPHRRRPRRDRVRRSGRRTAGRAGRPPRRADPRGRLRISRRQAGRRPGGFIVNTTIDAQEYAAVHGPRAA